MFIWILLFLAYLRLYIQVFKYLLFTPYLLHQHTAQSLIYSIKWTPTHTHICISVTYRCCISLWRYMYHIYRSVYIEVCLYVLVRNVYMYLCMHYTIYIYIYIYILYTCTTCIHTYLRTYVRTYVHTYIYTYIRTYIHTTYLLTNSLFTYLLTYLLYHQLLSLFLVERRAAVKVFCLLT